MEKIIIVGHPKTLPEVALALLKLTSDEVKQIKQVLAEEYGIVPKNTECLRKEIPFVEKNLEAVPQILPSVENIESFVKTRQRETEKSGWHVPKIIGKPCKGKFSKRK